MAGAVFTPYTTGAPLFGTKPSWIPDPLDQQRIQSYQLYEEMYWNAPDIYKLTQRGTNELPIYIPKPRVIVDTTHRFTASDFRVITKNALGKGQTPDVVAAQLALGDLMTRERFRSKFNGNKRYGLMRGDWIWHITGDETKPLGRRLSVTALDPGMYFPITEDDDVDRVIGCHLVEQIETSDGPRIRRLTYRKLEGGGVTVEDGIFELDKWNGPDVRAKVVLKPPTQLPPEITALPVFHIKNTEEPGNPFGSSVLRGLERLASAINQTISDEDLALALDGIGMYATDGSQPVDKSGNEIPWRLGPGRVVHTDGSFFNRVSGVGSVTPYGDHYDRLWNAMKEAAATPDVAIGGADVSTAESGIALALRMSPMLATAGEKNDIVIDVHNQLFWTIVNEWMPAYEDTTFKDVSVTCTVGDPVPVDRAARFAELNDMLDRGVIDTEYYRTEATKLGYEFPEGIGEKATKEYDSRNSVVDPFADRVNQDLGDPNANPPTDA